MTTTNSPTVSKKTVYLIRHGQALHNVGPNEDHSIRDPVLTDLGIEQSKELSKQLADKKIKFDAIVCSPMRRTLQTMELGLKDYLAKEGVEKIPVYVNPLFQEVGNLPCDVGLEVKELSSLYPRYDLKYCVDGIYPEKKDIYDVDVDISGIRSKYALEYLSALPHENIAVISHSAFIRFLLKKITRDVDINFLPPELTFNNCEIREYFLKPDGNEFKLCDVE
ncbi:phosphoglycerate mutase family protein [Schizosaccharomyces cryophilus OY26]|uniref:Phosphoglycerate mutase family protein n=1 Tax=Schizosaccharomyces cryophilus (strain OY26 / ATCC MYA-4695 / CBS 11777 / NBRC 106824 / NRRL Y48691) TaxID=653667 RepID=S9W2M9_SCHCR|nr:phosphoglycerate mutase family protein [Schizosaccharomyces cryophilus OY26]EPY52709.1 phosphoglycerate mutase family protein [Schizosaccharomyces cryophilus OY26]